MVGMVHEQPELTTAIAVEMTWPKIASDGLTTCARARRRHTAVA
jgi:hypothetical protein